jgi:hypothetical protein
MKWKILASIFDLLDYFRARGVDEGTQVSEDRFREIVDFFDIKVNLGIVFLRRHRTDLSIFN